MSTAEAWIRDLHPDWRAALVGVLAAPVLMIVGLLNGWIQGGLVPPDCQGLACLYFGLLVGYTIGLLVVWAVIAGVVALTHGRWPESDARLWILRVLAGLSYAPTLWVLALALDVT